MPQLDKTKNKKLIEDYIAKYTGKKKNQATLMHNSLQQNTNLVQRKLALNKNKNPKKTKNSMSLSHSLNFSDISGLGPNRGRGQKYGPSAALRNSISSEMYVNSEKKFLRSVLQSSLFFYLMLQHILDFVDYKIQKINEYIFHETGLRQSELRPGDLNNDPKSLRSHDSGVQPETFQNYFDLLKTDSYQKQTSNIQQAINHFLAEIPMIVYYDITQV